MSGGCNFVHDDGAYVLGALSPAERAAYERHLTGCAACQHAVGEIAVLPGLLGRLDPGALKRADEQLAPGTRLPALIEAAATARDRERRARRWRYAGTALAAACLALVAGLGTGWLGPTPMADDPPPAIAMRPEREAIPVRAELRLQPATWGTQITMHCAYEPSDSHVDTYVLHLAAYGPDGAREQVASWLAAPGDDITLTGATRFVRPDLVRLELTRHDGVVLLAYDVP